MSRTIPGPAVLVGACKFDSIFLVGLKIQKYQKVIIHAKSTILNFQAPGRATVKISDTLPFQSAAHQSQLGEASLRVHLPERSFAVKFSFDM